MFFVYMRMVSLLALMVSMLSPRCPVVVWSKMVLVGVVLARGSVVVNVGVPLLAWGASSC